MRKLKTYNPWTDQKAIKKLLDYEVKDSGPYIELVYLQRFGRKTDGCPYCHKSTKGATIRSVCGSCGKVINALLSTPFNGSKIPLFTWFDCLYWYMGADAKKEGKAPIAAAIEIEVTDVIKQYGLSKLEAKRLRRGCIELVYPEVAPFWDNDSPGPFPKKGAFDKLLRSVVKS
jgi:hypothetical protein